MHFKKFQGLGGRRETHSGTARGARLCALALLLSLSACASGDFEDKAQKQIAKAEQKAQRARPDASRYAIRDTYAYDNPKTIWHIVDVGFDRVFWQSSRGDKMTTGFDPLLPAYAWSRESLGSGRRSLTRFKGGLYPIKVGRRVEFLSRVESSVGQQTFKWQCAATARKRILVPAGEFDTIEVHCRRKFYDLLIYYYAPSLGRIVKVRIGGQGLAPVIERQLLWYVTAAGESEVQEAPADGENIPPYVTARERLFPPPSAQGSLERYGIVLPPVAPAPFLFPPPLAEPNPLLSESLSPEGSETPPPPSLPTPQSPLLPQFLSPEAEGQLDRDGGALAARPGTPTTQPAGLKLGQFSSLSKARSTWQDLNEKFKTAFAGKRYDIRRRRDSTRGVLYELYTLPYVSKAAAAKTCALLQKTQPSIPCEVVALPNP